MDCFRIGIFSVVNQSFFEYFASKIYNSCIPHSFITSIKEDLVRVDICQQEEIIRIIEEFKPTCIIHCAAQRFPDKVEQDPAGTLKLNVEATKNLATLAGLQILYTLLNKPKL